MSSVIISQIHALIKSKRYQESISLLEDIIELSSNSYELKKFAYETLIEVKTTIEESNDELYIKFANHLSLSEDRRKINEIGKAIFKKLDRRSISEKDLILVREKIIRAMIEEGELELGIERLKEYLNYLIKWKRNEQIIKTIEELGKVLDKGTQLFYESIAYVNQSNTLGLCKLLIENPKNFPYKSLINLNIRDTGGDKPELDLAYMRGLLESDLTASERRKFVNCAIRFLLNNSIQDELFRVMEQYCAQTGVNIFSQESRHGFGRFDLDLPDATAVREERMTIDMGEDLFSSENEGETGELALLLRRIEKLRLVGDRVELAKAMQALKKIDKHNKLISELSENEEQAVNKIGVEEILAVTDRADKAAEEFYYLQFSDEIESNDYQDYVIALNDMNMHGAAKKLLLDVKGKGSDLKSKVKWSYLYAETLLLAKEPSEAVDDLLEMITEEDLNFFQRIHLQYLLAECLLQLGATNDALAMYREIKTLRSGYRLVDLRIREILFGE